MRSNLLTDEQKDELVRSILTAATDFCTKNDIDIESVSSEEWETLRNQIVGALAQCVKLIGGEKLRIQV